MAVITSLDNEGSWAFLDDTKWIGGSAPVSETDSFTITTGNTVTLSASFWCKTSDGTINDGASLIVTNSSELKANTSGKLTVHGLVDVQSGSLFLSGTHGGSTATGIIILGAGTTWTLGGAVTLAGSTYIHGTTDWSFTSIINITGKLFLRDGTLALMGTTSLEIETTGSLSVQGGVMTREAACDLQIFGNGKVFMDRRMVFAPIDATTAYGPSAKPGRIGV